MRIGMLVALAAFAAGCSHPSDNPVSLTAVSGSDWRLLRWDADGNHVPLVNGSEITLVIATDGKVAGKASINRYTGSMTLDADGKVTWSPGFATTMMAGSPPLMDQETRYLKALIATNHLSLLGPRLMLTNGSTTFEFTKIAP